MIEEFIAWFWDYATELAGTGVTAVLGFLYRRQIKRMIGKIRARREDALIGRLEDKLLDRLDEKLAERLDTRIDQMLKELRPPPPPHGMSGSSCQKTGLYRTQGRFRVEKTFTEGDTFTKESFYHQLENVVWVYQYPE